VIMSDTPFNAPSGIDIGGNRRLRVLTVTANTVLTKNNVIANVTTGGVEVTLPSSPVVNDVTTVKNSSNAPITIIGSIEEETNMVLYSAESIDLIYDGATWRGF